MPNQTNPNTVAALERIIQEIRYLVDHPRIQQRTWVGSGKTWLPLLQIIHGELTGQTANAAADDSPPRADKNTGSLLVEVSSGDGHNVMLANVQQVEVYRGEPGYRSVRGAHSGFALKDGCKYLTSANEAQRLVDVMRQRDEAASNEQK
ncbi:MAG: hypothetical protein IPO91_04395 [Chloroflexi bacterium]|nr:hypothetical protein [Chloroflexota bacterium]